MLLLIRFFINTGALLVLPYFINGISVKGIYSAAISVILLAIVNTCIRPIVKLLTLPLSILTLGFFALVINGLFFWFVASFVDGFAVMGFWPAFWGALVMSLVAWMTNTLLSSK